MKKTVTLNGLTVPNALFVIVCAAMIMVGAYMTNHYFQVHFPSGLAASSSLCDINQFWSCDKATNSPLGSIFNVPTSAVAIIMGVFGLICAFAAKEALEQTLKLILIANLIVCVGLAIYSLTALGGLCLMCTVYYVLSGIAVFIFFKWSTLPPAIEPKSLAGFVVVALVPSLVLGLNISNKKSKMTQTQASFVSQFKALNAYGDASFESPFTLNKATENFKDAPIQVILFSDFQCPFCKSIAKQFHEIIPEFKDKMNVQYMFYPLDMTCNKDMKGSLHPFACYSAYLAACDESKFEKIHDHIFANQDKINLENIKLWEKEFGLSGCLDNKDAQDMVQQSLNAGKFFKLKSTPTMIINGKKIEGGLDTPVLRAILRSLVE